MRNIALKLCLAAVAVCGPWFAAGQDMGMVSIKADPRINRLLNLRIETNREGRLVDGFVIQIFYGRSQKAAEVLNSFLEADPDVHAEIKYDTPDYKVFVGAYLTEQQAREALSRLKQNPDYSGAFVRPKQITVYD